MVSAGIVSVDQPLLNRRLRRSVHKWEKGLFNFAKSSNSIYEERHYRDVYMTAIMSTKHNMIDGASLALNKYAAMKGQTPLYIKGRRTTENHSYKSGHKYGRCKGDKKDRYVPKKFYPAGKTVREHIKREFHMAGGVLQQHSGKRHADLLQRKLDEIIANAVKRHFITPVSRLTGYTAAFDFSDEDHWGLPTMDLVRTRAEGTTLAFRYGDTRIISKDAEYLLPPLMFRPRSSVVETLAKSLDQADRLRVPLETLLLDRQFFSVDAINFLRGRGKQHLMPAKVGSLKAEMQRDIRNAPKDHVSVFDYTIGDTPHSAKTKIVVVPPPWQYPSTRGRPQKHPRKIVFATSIRPQPNATQIDIDEYGRELSRIYRYRFGIETDWNVLKSFRPRTTSKNPVLRMFNFYMSVLKYNGWVFARRIHVDSIGGGLMRLEFFLLYVATSDPIDPLVLAFASGNG